ncbi:MAG: Clp protease N-terminal domain-containing protein [Solirubrobacteraceae bacterium]
MACCDPRGALERFCDRAPVVLVLADEEARTSGQGCVGSEHLLLCLVDQEDAIAKQALARWVSWMTGSAMSSGLTSRGCRASATLVRLAAKVLSTFGVDAAALNDAVDPLFPTAGGPVLARRDRGFPQTDWSIDDWLAMPPSDSTGCATTRPQRPRAPRATARRSGSTATAQTASPSRAARARPSAVR